MIEPSQKIYDIGHDQDSDPKVRNIVAMDVGGNPPQRI